MEGRDGTEWAWQSRRQGNSLGAMSEMSDQGNAKIIRLNLVLI